MESITDMQSCAKEIQNHYNNAQLAANLTFYFNVLVILAGCVFREKLTTQPQTFIKYYLAAGVLMILLGLLDLYLARPYCPSSCSACSNLRRDWSVYPFMAMFVGGIWIHAGMQAHVRAQATAGNGYENEAIENVREWVEDKTQKISRVVAGRSAAAAGNISDDGAQSQYVPLSQA